MEVICSKIEHVIETSLIKLLLCKIYDLLNGRSYCLSFLDYIRRLIKKIFFKDFIYLLLERREGRKKERERHQKYERYMDWLPLTRTQLGTWPPIQAFALTGNRTRYLSVHRPALNPLSLTCQGKRLISFKIG